MHYLDPTLEAVPVVPLWMAEAEQRAVRRLNSASDRDEEEDGGEAEVDEGWAAHGCLGGLCAVGDVSWHRCLTRILRSGSAT